MSKKFFLEKNVDIRRPVQLFLVGLGGRIFGHFHKNNYS